MLDGGLRATLTCVDPRALAPAFAGRAFDAKLLADLPAGVDPCGERGEFHTFAWDGPMFAAPVPVRAGEVVAREGFVFADLLPAVLGPEWAPASPLLSILSIAMIARSVAALPGYYFAAIGRPQLTTALAVIRLAVLAAVLWPLWKRFQVEGVCWAVVVSNAALLPAAALCGLSLRSAAPASSPDETLPVLKDGAGTPGPSTL